MEMLTDRAHTHTHIVVVVFTIKLIFGSTEELRYICQIRNNKEYSVTVTIEVVVVLPSMVRSA